MRTDFPALPLRLPAAFIAVVSAVAPVPLPAQAQAAAQAQRVDVCALVACSASGQPAAAFAEPATARRAASPTVSPVAVPPSIAPDRIAPAAPTRDPWAHRLQGRESDDDACLLNFGLDGQLARKGTFDTHVLGRTQAWRGPRR